MNCFIRRLKDPEVQGLLIAVCLQQASQRLEPSWADFSGFMFHVKNHEICPRSCSYMMGIFGTFPPHSLTEKLVVESLIFSLI